MHGRRNLRDGKRSCDWHTVWSGPLFAVGALVPAHMAPGAPQADQRHGVGRDFRWLGAIALRPRTARGRRLIQATCLWAPERVATEHEVRAQLSRMWGARTGDRLNIAGDPRETPSTQGVLLSGMRAPDPCWRHPCGVDVVSSWPNVVQPCCGSAI